MNTVKGGKHHDRTSKNDVEPINGQLFEKTKNSAVPAEIRTAVHTD
jgi:hypothetical protein